MNRASRSCLGLLAVILVGCTGSPGSSEPAVSSAAAPSPDVQMVLSSRDASATTSAVISATVTNVSSRAITYQSSGCGLPVTVQLEVPVPNGSAGVAQTRLASVFKQYVLSQGLGPRGLPALEPVAEPFGPTCPKVPTDLILNPGQSTSGSATWTKDFTPDVPVAPGQLTATITFNYDPLPIPKPATVSPSSGADGLRPPPPMVVEQYRQLTTALGVVIVGDTSVAPAISASEAVDAALRDPSFSAWLLQQPQASWINANLYLDTRGWHVELFVQPRAFALVVLDPTDGTIRSVQVCAAPVCNQ